MQHITHRLPAPAEENILIIRLGALGDFVQSFGPFQAIREAHPQAHITLLTTKPFVAFASPAPWFDAVLTDERPRWSNLKGMMQLRRQLRGYDRIYDLQTSGRTARYFYLAGQRHWSGHVPAGTFFHANPWRNDMHTVPRQRDQLRMAGIADVPLPDISWLQGMKDPARQAPYALIVPGASPHRPEKRWPAASYGELARHLVRTGITPVVVGAGADKALAAEICALCPQTEDYTGRTTLAELAVLAEHACLAVGNDTGPIHLAAMMGCECIVLYSAHSSPALTMPLGRRNGQVQVLSEPDLARLSVGRVAEALMSRH